MWRLSVAGLRAHWQVRMHACMHRFMQAWMDRCVCMYAWIHVVPFMFLCDVCHCWHAQVYKCTWYLSMCTCRYVCVRACVWSYTAHILQLLYKSVIQLFRAHTHTHKHTCFSTVAARWHLSMRNHPTLKTSFLFEGPWRADGTHGPGT